MPVDESKRNDPAWNDHRTFFLPPAAWRPPYELDAGETRHLTRVLRLGPGEEIRVLDGEGREGIFVVEACDRHRTRLRLVEEWRHPRPHSRVILAAGWTKAARRGWFLEKAVEFEAEGVWLCGSRGWLFEGSEGYDPLVVAREEGRIRRSLEAAPPEGEKLLFLHYPPLYSGQELPEFFAAMADCGVAEYLLERNDALIIESFGVGGLPTYKAGDYYETVKAGLDAGKTVVMTTQVENEGSDLAVYHVGAGIKRNLPILEAYDMTSEAVTAKLMWILGQTTDRAWVQELFYTPVACDILAGK